MTPTAADPARAPSPRTVLLLIGLLCLIWGSTWSVIAVGLKDLPPFTSAGLRLGIACVVMTVVARFLHGIEGGARPTVRLSLVMGLGSFSISYGIIYWTQQWVPSCLVSLIWAVFPIFMATGGHFYLRTERIRPAQVLGFVAAFAGVGLLYMTDIRKLGPDAVVAAPIVLLSPLVSALGTLYVKRHGGGTSSLLLNRNGMAIGAVLLSAVAFLDEGDRPIAWTPSAIASLAYLAIIGTVIAFGLYFWLMRYATATGLSLISYVTPLVAVALGSFLLDEPVGLPTVLGGALILGGVAIAGRRKPMPAGARALPTTAQKAG